MGKGFLLLLESYEVHRRNKKRGEENKASHIQSSRSFLMIPWQQFMQVLRSADVVLHIYIMLDYVPFFLPTLVVFYIGCIFCPSFLPSFWIVSK